MNLMIMLAVGLSNLASAQIIDLNYSPNEKRTMSATVKHLDFNPAFVSLKQCRVFIEKETKHQHLIKRLMKKLGYSFVSRRSDANMIVADTNSKFTISEKLNNIQVFTGEVYVERSKTNKYYSTTFNRFEIKEWLKREALACSEL